MRLGQLCAAGTVVMALGAAPARGDAQHLAARSVPGAGRDVPVQTRFVRELAHGCRYEAGVRGTVRVLAPTRRADRVTLVAPDLEITARLECPTTPPQHAQGVVRGVPRSRAELERAIETRTRIAVASGDVVCVYAARFDFDGETLAAHSLARWCRPPRHLAHRGAIAQATPR